MHVQGSHEQDFLETLWRHYDSQGRHELPWRLPASGGTFDPYHILVSELMLQQTQVSRVIDKYTHFLAKFPNITALARASLADVLTEWQGLGYNRRAKFLWQAAKLVVESGKFPATVSELMALPGVGKNTAGAIMAYAYNKPATFIETNVRTVYIFHFFPNDEAVSDKAIAELLERTLDTEHPREFYWALMDYGSHLKKTVRNNHQSKQYVRQSKFQGSNRQLRGAVLRELTIQPRSQQYLVSTIVDPRLQKVLNDLKSEDMIQEQAGEYRLAE